MSTKKSRWKRIWVSIQNVPLFFVGKKLVSPERLMKDRGPLVIDTATPEMLLAGAQRQWKRLHDTEFQVKEASEQIEKMSRGNRSSFRTV